MSDPLECPECQSHKVSFKGKSIICADCGSLIEKLGKLRTAAAGVRHRREKAEVEVTPIALPTSHQLGALHFHTEQIIGNGPQALIDAHRRGARAAQRFGEELVEQWRLKTVWLKELEVTHRGRVRVNYAMRWRPTFLACVALTHSTMLGERAAEVSPGTVIAHRNEDKEFDQQVNAAQTHCIELLHSVAMRRVIEGDCEPILWQGIPVAYIKKFDGRLQLEMLRAHMPKTFKTPGSKDALINGDNNQVLIVDAATRDRLVAQRQEALQAMKRTRDALLPAIPATLLP